MSSDWEFKADFSNVAAAGMGSAPTEECYVIVKVFNSEVRDTQRGDKRCILRCMVTEGPQANAVITDGMNFPTAENFERVLRYWKAMLLSLGIDRKALDKGEVKINGKTVLGRTGFVHFLPAPEGGYSSVRWLTKDQFTMLTKGAEPTAPAAVKKKAAPAPAPEPKVEAAPEPIVEAAPEADEADPLGFLTL